MEKIGQVILDDTLYPGKDLYTDGAIEDEMLEIARTYSEEELNHVIAERSSWPILYHFSHIRENILSWVPFSGDEKVLEIGSGCGAVTGALCKNAAEVTCIELSRKRSLINAYRHKDCDNLKILMGNFQDIEENLTEKYDYITLIGVFEYGEAYIDSENPYVDFLKIISKHLKDGGKIILAIENRLGLKYWAGCTEDHFGTLFEGIEGYPRTKGVKTFSKKEFNKILKDAGNLKASWFYPFPDYKLPLTIYSDRRLPQKGELNHVESNYDRLRLQLFQESAVYDSLISNDMYPEFANSFLLMIGKEDTKIDTVYAKFSNERSQDFAIRTEIHEDSLGKKSVHKLPANNKAAAHTKQLPEVFKKLSPLYEREGLYLNTCEEAGEDISFEYLEGITLEEKLDELLEKGKFDELENLLFTYINKIKHIHEGEIFFKTPEFIEVFGDADLKDGLRCSGISNIDLVPANILIDKDKASVIDYEWTFSFPIPCKFIIYRMILYYMESDGKRISLKERELYKKARITDEEIEIFAEMEKSFQNYMEGGHVPIREMYSEVSPGKVDAALYFERIRAAQENRRLQVFYDRGENFSEKDSDVYPMGRHGVDMAIKIPDGVKRLRLDPGEAAGGLVLKKLSTDGKSNVQFCTNGFALGDNRYYFGGGDPQFIIDEIPAGADKLSVEFEILNEASASEEFWQKFSEKQFSQNQEVINLKNKINEMENTKVWKLYKGIKRN